MRAPASAPRTSSSRNFALKPAADSTDALGVSGIGVQGRAPVPADEPGGATKLCPECGATVHAAARLCFCYHRFDASEATHATTQPTLASTQDPQPDGSAAVSFGGASARQASASPVDAPSPDGAVRARLNAAICDQLLLGVLVRGLGAGGGLSTVDYLGLAIVLQFAYFTAQELRGGKTIGKRAFHIHVATLAGDRPSARQIVVRNLLRPFDALPAAYASGLLSLMRTGRARRQRIGDVAAGTAVLLDPGAHTLRTPSWLLPVAALFATVLSLALILPLLNHSSRASVSGGVYVHVGGEAVRSAPREPS